VKVRDVGTAVAISNPRIILALLTGLNFLNYLDRLVVAAVLPAMQHELAFSNFVAGMLATVFLIGYFVTSPAFGLLGDRRERKWLIALGVAVWSAATFASGLARGTGELIAARAFVGVGEASYATLAPTIIDDLAPPERRGRWLAIFYSAIPIGSALGYLSGGVIERLAGWRVAFFTAGGPGLLLAVTCLFIVEPVRAASREKASPLAAFGTLVASPLYMRGVLGYCAFTFALGGFSFWAPTFLARRYELSLLTANTVFGLITVITGFAGTALGGWLADRAAQPPPVPPAIESPAAGVYRAATLRHLDEAGRERWAVLGYLRVCSIATLIATPIAALCFASPTAPLFFGLAFVCELSLFVTTSPSNAMILRSVPPFVRASAMALSIFAIHLLGDLWSPPLIGALADVAPMQWAMSVVPLAFGLSAAIWWKRRE
jgi:MFS family permease